MSFVVNTLMLNSYDGQVVGLPIAICTKPNMEPRQVGVTINWADLYSSSVNGTGAVVVDLAMGANMSGAPLDKVRSIKIDNSFCPVGVFVQFDDTKDTVYCPPNSIVILPVFTNSQKCTVIGIDLFTGRPPKTTVQFFNVPQDAAYIPGVLLNSVDVRFCNQSYVSSGNNVLTFPTVNAFAPAGTDRLIVFTVTVVSATLANFSFTGVTINGLAATIDDSLVLGFTVSRGQAVGHVLVPSGTTLAAVVTTSGAVAKAGLIEFFALTDWTSQTPISTATEGSSVVGLRSIVMSAIPGAGGVFACYDTTNDGAAEWNGAELISNTVAAGNLEVSTAEALFEESNSYNVSCLAGNMIIGAVWN